MSLCSLCGMQLAGEANLCPHHYLAVTDGWATDNRLMWDLLHRGLVPSREARRSVAEAA
jgi:hypothetical protein